MPELLSNKVILTPVAPGNQRGAVWADRPLQQQSWIADVEFRTNGPERGGGNMNIWLVRDGAHVIGSNSIYTAGRFEGLALVIDQHDGSGGMLRGFLNDGTTDYMTHHNVDSLAFAQCRFSYRNLGRPTQIKLRHNEFKFSVEVAGRTCFQSDRIRLPSGYNFGITAASADNPDSFEVFKLVVLTGDSGGNNNNNNNNNNQNINNNYYQQQQQQQQQQQRVGRSPGEGSPYEGGGGLGEDARAQFAEVKTRLQNLNQQLAGLQRAVSQNAGAGEQRDAEAAALLGELRELVTGRVLAKVDVLERRVGDVEREMRSLRQEVAGRLREAENAIKYHVSDKHESLTGQVESQTRRGHMRLIAVVVLCQLLLVGVYSYHKRRKISPKKYL